MISFIFSVEIINFWFLEPRIVLSIPSFVADAAVVNPNSNKTLSDNIVSTFLINAKSVFFIGPKTSSLILISLVVSFSKFFLFSRDLIAFIISYIPSFVSVFPEPKVVVNFCVNIYSQTILLHFWVVYDHIYFLLLFPKHLKNTMHLKFWNHFHEEYIVLLISSQKRSVLIIIYRQTNYLQKSYDVSQLVYQLIIIIWK